MKNKNEVVMTNNETGKETEVHVDSIAAMEACGWSVKKGEKIPVTKADPVATTDATKRTDAEQAERDEHDAGAKKATVPQLKEALDQIGIKYEDDAKKADLLALYLARP